MRQATALLGPTTDVELLLDLAQAQAGISGQVGARGQGNMMRMLLCCHHLQGLAYT